MMSLVLDCGAGVWFETTPPKRERHGARISRNLIYVEKLLSSINL